MSSGQLFVSQMSSSAGQFIYLTGYSPVPKLLTDSKEDVVLNREAGHPNGKKRGLDREGAIKLTTIIIG